MNNRLQPIKKCRRQGRQKHRLPPAVPFRHTEKRRRRLQSPGVFVFRILIHVHRHFQKPQILRHPHQFAAPPESEIVPHHHERSHAVAFRVTDDRRFRFIPPENLRGGPQFVGERQGPQHPAALFFARRSAVKPHDVPHGLMAARQPRPVAYEFFGTLGAGEPHEHGVSCGISTVFHGAPRTVFRVRPLCHAPQRQFPQREKIPFLKEPRQRRRDGLFEVNFSRFESCDEIRGRQINEPNLVGFVKQPIRHRFPNVHPDHALDDVVQTFQVLHVQRTVDVDPCRQEFFHILPTLGVARPRGIAVREFVHNDQGRALCEHGVDVELFVREIRGFDDLSRQNREPRQFHLGIGPMVGIDPPHQHVESLRPFFLRFLQHRVGLADARRRSEKELELSAMRLLHGFKEFVRGLIGGFRHRESPADGAAPSSVRSAAVR